MKTGSNAGFHFGFFSRYSLGNKNIANAVVCASLASFARVLIRNTKTAVQSAVFVWPSSVLCVFPLRCVRIYKIIIKDRAYA